MFWKKEEIPSWKTTDFSLDCLYLLLSFGFGCSDSTVFEYYRVSLVTHNSVAVYVSHQQSTCFVFGKKWLLLVLTRKAVLFLQNVWKEFLHHQAVLSQVNWESFAIRLLCVLEKDSAAGICASHGWCLQLIMPQLRGSGLVKAFALVFLAAMKRKFENPKCLVEFLWPFGNFLDTCTCWALICMWSLNWHSSKLNRPNANY